MRYVDITGQKFRTWTAVKYVGKNKFVVSLWLCRCDCGAEAIVQLGQLRTLKKGCRCDLEAYKAAHRKHGHTTKHTQSSTYNAWTSMKHRYNNSNNKYFYNYGGRGITVCDRWQDSFENFLEDMKERPLGMTLERIDSSKGYCAENCKWSTMEEQGQNRRSNRLVVYNNETFTTSKLARKFNINPQALRNRLNLGWDLQRALTAPILKYKKQVT